MLHGHSFSRWGNKDIVHCFDLKCRHYIVYELLPQSNIYINKDEIPKIVDAPLMLIFRMGHRVCCWSYGT